MTCPQLHSTMTTQLGLKPRPPTSAAVCALLSDATAWHGSLSSSFPHRAQSPSDSGSLAEAGQVSRWRCTNNHTLVSGEGPREGPFPLERKRS